MAFEGVGYTAADQYALALYASAVGGGMSSRLFQELREERGLAYSVYAFHSPYADTGLFGVYMATARKEAARAQSLARQVLEAPAAALPPAELERATAQATPRLLIGLDSVSARCAPLSRPLVHYRRSGDASPPAAA